MMKNSLALVVSGMLLITALAMNACTAEKTNQVSVNYVVPKSPAYQHIYTLLAEKDHTLEKLQEILSPFRLPWTLEISLTECGGEADATYGHGTITICYEYIDKLWNRYACENHSGWNRANRYSCRTLSRHRSTRIRSCLV